MVLQERKSAMTAIYPITSISQGHLNIWETCQRRYQYKFLEALSLPEADLDRKKKLQLGSEFHLLMQQQQLGLDISDLAGSNERLQAWLAAFSDHPPDMIEGDRLCEHRRTLEVSHEILSDDNQNRDQSQGYFVLTAIYDLLILGDRQAQILDWKTHQVAIAADKLKANWQTQLYLYLLAKTTDYAPEQLSMTYWFANTAQSVIINYSQTDYECTGKKIQNILREIAQAQEYPTLKDIHSSDCKHCEFRDRCDRGEIITKFTSNNLEDIPEVVI